VELADIATILLLVALEGALSADNALVLAVLVLPLPRAQQKKALRYGILGAFVFRIICIFFAKHLIAFNLAKLIGSVYLFYLPIKHFFRQVESEKDRYIPPAKAMLGLSLFWSVVTRVELTDIVFAIDSILVGVAVSKKLWVVITGGILGVIAIRVVIGKLLGIIEKYPAIVDGAYLIVGWVAIKLLIEYLHGIHWIEWEIPKWFSLTLIGVIFVASLFYARKKQAAEIRRDAKAKKILEASNLD
jgi:YkoY family integral membrane protein